MLNAFTMNECKQQHVYYLCLSHITMNASNRMKVAKLIMQPATMLVWLF